MFWTVIARHISNSHLSDLGVWNVLLRVSSLRDIKTYRIRFDLYLRWNLSVSLNLNLSVSLSVSISIPDKDMIFGRWKLLKWVFISINHTHEIKIHKTLFNLCERQRLEYCVLTPTKDIEKFPQRWRLWKWVFISIDGDENSQNKFSSLWVKDLIIEFLSPTEIKTMKMNFHFPYGFWTNVFSSLRVETMKCMSLSLGIKTSLCGFDLWEMKAHKTRFECQR